MSFVLLSGLNFAGISMTGLESVCEQETRKYCRDGNIYMQENYPLTCAWNLLTSFLLATEVRAIDFQNISMLVVPRSGSLKRDRLCNTSHP